MWVATQTRAYPQWRCPHDSDPLECLSHVPYLLYFQSRAHSFALFCTPQKLNSFIFKRFRTLRQKTQPPRVGERGTNLTPWVSRNGKFDPVKVALSMRSTGHATSV